MKFLVPKKKKKKRERSFVKFLIKAPYDTSYKNNFLMFYSFEDFFSNYIVVALRNKSAISWWLEVDWGREKAELNWEQYAFVTESTWLVFQEQVCYLKAAQSSANSLSVISRRQPCAWYFIRLVPSLLKLQTISVYQVLGSCWWKSLLFLNIHVIPSKNSPPRRQVTPRRLVTSFQRASSLSALLRHTTLLCITL